MRLQLSVYGWLTVLLLICITPAAATPRYKPQPQVPDAGSIVGFVSFEGEPPAPATLKTTDRGICHKETIPDESLVVSKAGRVRWAVVSIKKIKTGKGFSSQSAPTLKQEGCRFLPHVLLARPKQPLTVLNNDGILHNVHVYARRNRSSNIAMGSSVKSMELTFRRPETVRIECDVHPWMRAFVVVAAHPYYAVTGADGAFALKDVPPGKYKLQVWHETLGKLEWEVTVKAKAAAKVEFVFTQQVGRQ